MKHTKTQCIFEYYANPQAVNNIIISWLNSHNYKCYESNGFRYIRTDKNQYFNYHFKDNKVFIDLYFGTPDKPVSLSDIFNVSKAEAYGNEIIDLIRKVNLLSAQNGKDCNEFQLGSFKYRTETFEENWKRECRKYRNKYLKYAYLFLFISIVAFGCCTIIKPYTYWEPRTRNINGLSITTYEENTDMSSYKAEMIMCLCIAIPSAIVFFVHSILALKSEKKKIAILLLSTVLVVLTGGAVVYMLANF